MRNAALLLATLISGCSMSSGEVIAEVKRCQDAGMRAVPMQYLWSGRIAEVQCWPKEPHIVEVPST